MIVVVMGDGASPPRPPPPGGGGAKDGELTIMGGRDADMSGTVGEPTMCTGTDADDGNLAESAPVLCCTLSAPPSRKPSILATIGGGAARASLNFELF
jgi:hypothetical protein